MKIPFGKLCLTGAVALGSVTPAMATPSGHGQHGKADQHRQAGKHRVHKVMYVFRGTWNAAAGTVTVKAGNAHVRHAGLIGQGVQFDLAGARLVVADTNGDGAKTLDDLKDGDLVLVTARLPRKDPGTQPFTARMLIDRTNAPEQSSSSD